MPALEGEQVLTVRAKNKNGTESVVTRKFVSDSKGPSITEAKPKDGDLVGNVVTISAEVKDPAGVLASSVVAVFANGPGTEYTIPLNPARPGGQPPGLLRHLRHPRCCRSGRTRCIRRCRSGPRTTWATNRC
jgi:hypothetical protein